MILALALASPASLSADQDLFYKYKNAQGRTVYVNDPARIPKEFRSQLKPVDLSHISLNPQLANELKAELDREVKRLKEEIAQRESSPEKRCSEQGEEPAPSWFTLLWERYAALVLIAGLLLLLLLFTPAITRRIDPGRWTRLLMFLMPLLGTIALITYTSIRTTRILREFQEERPRCAAEPSGPFQNLRELRQTLKRVEHQRERAFQGEPTR